MSSSVEVLLTPYRRFVDASSRINGRIQREKPYNLLRDSPLTTVPFFQAAGKRNRDQSAQVGEGR
jgi:hypothetical protein